MNTVADTAKNITDDCIKCSVFDHYINKCIGKYNKENDLGAVDKTKLDRLEHVKDAAADTFDQMIAACDNNFVSVCIENSVKAAGRYDVCQNGSQDRHREDDDIRMRHFELLFCFHNIPL